MFQNNHHKNALKTYKNEVELQKVRWDVSEEKEQQIINILRLV